jgi:phosphatidate cytidylyltransferase
MKRTIVALSFAALVVSFFCYATVAIVKPVLIAVILLTQLEFYKIIQRKTPVMIIPGVVAGFVFLVSQFYFYDSCFPLIFFFLAIFALFKAEKSSISEFAMTTIGFVYIPMMLAYLIRIAMLPSPNDIELFWLLYAIAIVKISDMGGFAFGLGSAKIFGSNHKMCPTISPNKSWEGLFGSVFGSCLISSCFIPLTGFSFQKSLFFGVTAAIVGTLGDLVESRIKRDCEVKDSSVFMPAGLGGLLDMTDSLIFAPAIIYSLLAK